MIRERRAELSDAAANAVEAKADLLSLFLLAKTSDLARKDSRSKDSNSFDTNLYDDGALHAIIMSFIIAGRDTTACCLSWTAYILSTHADVQAKLCEEVDRVLGGTDGAPTIEQLSATSMPYLNGVIYESLRLYPPVPEEFKICNCAAGDTLPGGTHVPCAMRVHFSPYVMGRDPERYAEPYSIRPERWIPFQQPSQYEFPVFQAGQRICLGMTMALFEAKLLLVQILKKYSFTLYTGEAEKITYSLTLTMAVCNSKTHDSHELLLVPHRRH